MREEERGDKVVREWGSETVKERSERGERVQKEGGRG